MPDLFSFVEQRRKPESDPHNLPRRAGAQLLDLVDEHRQETRRIEPMGGTFDGGDHVQVFVDETGERLGSADVDPDHQARGR